MLTFYSRWALLIGLALFMALVVSLIRPPQPLAAEAPATAFAAGRALRDVAIIARQPHGIGTPANAAVRDYIVRRCRALGCSATIQDTTVLVASGGQLTLGRVQNIIARMPGRQPGGKAVLVVAHYDSQPHTPGAGDDAAGGAALLETMRALRAGPPLAHDIIWLFTDGEEVGLLGARAYAADTARLRRTVGVALNFEGRGNRGPSLTFEVSPQNGWVVREYARAVPTPLASSLFYEAYRHLPNDTDFTPLRQAGLTGLNFAFVDGYSYYHSPADTPAHLDLGSLQHHGEYMLSLVRHFGSISLAQTKAPDYTFFNPLGSWLVYYPAAWSLPLTALTILLVASTVVIACRRRRLSGPSLLGGALAGAGGLILLLGAGWGMLLGIKALYPQYTAFYDAAFYNVLAYQVALLALGGALFTAYYGWLSRWMRPEALVGGALLMVAILLVIMQWRAASSAFLLAWPLLFVTLAWARRLRKPIQDNDLPPADIIDALLLLPAVALLGQLVYLLLLIFGLGPLVLLALLIVALLLGLGLGLLLPVLAPGGARGGRALPLLGLAGAAGALAIGHATSQPTASRPQQTHLYYALDAAHHRAYWLSAVARPDGWTRHVFTAPQYRPLPALFPHWPRPVLHQAAPVLALGAPTLRMLADSSGAGQRHLRLRVLAGREGVTSLSLTIAAAGLRILRVAGHTVPAPDWVTSPDGISITLQAPRAAGELLELELASGQPLRVAATTRSLGLPALPGLPPLPASFVAMPGFSSFTTQVRQEFRL